MTIKKTIKIPIYECDVMVIITDQLAREAYRCAKKRGSMDDYEGSAGMVLYNTMDRYYVLFDVDHLGFNLIGHEMHHLVAVIGKNRDIYDEEALAWLAGKLLEDLMKFIQSKQDAIHGQIC